MTTVTPAGTDGDPAAPAMAYTPGAGPVQAGSPAVGSEAAALLRREEW